MLIFRESLKIPNLILAVALGASYYGLVKMGHGVRVGSGSARSFYLGVETGKNLQGFENLEGFSATKKQAICLVEPRGLDEGTRIELKDKKFEVLANQPVSFDVFSSKLPLRRQMRGHCRNRLTPSIPSANTHGCKVWEKRSQTNIPVQIEADYTEMGTLALWCRSCVSEHAGGFSFNCGMYLHRLKKPGFRMKMFLKNRLWRMYGQKSGTAFSEKTDNGYLDPLVKDISNIIEKAREKWPLGISAPYRMNCLNLSLFPMFPTSSEQVA